MNILVRIAACTIIGSVSFASVASAHRIAEHGAPMARESSRFEALDGGDLHVGQSFAVTRAPVRNGLSAMPEGAGQAGAP